MKEWLKSNEVYFTILSSTILAIMALIVSIKANEIAEVQNKIAYLESIPDFHISREYIDNETTPKKETVQLIISNSGGTAKNLEVGTESFIELELTDSLNNKIEKRFLLNGYFDGYFRTGQSKGHIRTVRGYNNNLLFSNFSLLLESKLKALGFKFVFVKQLTILQLNYIDILGEKITEFYNVSSGDGQLIKKEEELIDIYKSSSGFWKNDKVIKLREINEEGINQVIELITKKE